MGPFKMNLKNEMVEVTFEDHAISKKSHDSKTVCKARGRVLRITKKYIVLSHWEIHDRDPEVKKQNDKVIRILRSTVTYLVVFQKLETIPFIFSPWAFSSSRRDL